MWNDVFYCPTTKAALLDSFDSLIERGAIHSDYDEDRWICDNGVRTLSLNFSLQGLSPRCQALLDISVDAVVDRLKCYTILLTDSLSYLKICEHIDSIKRFLTQYGEGPLSLTLSCKRATVDFLGFIGLPEQTICEVELHIFGIKRPRGGSRKLSPIANYLVIDDQLTNMYDTGHLDDGTFKRWFPLLFWTKITLVLPLRATETLVTPFDCLKTDGTKTWLCVRRTQLKGNKRQNALQHIHHTVEGDYAIFTYRMPDVPIVEHIKRYQALTEQHHRRFLFDYADSNTNLLCSRRSLNTLMRQFWAEYIEGNPHYAFIRSQIDMDSKPILPGDSRPIAIYNLYSQKIDPDICRQLAGHANMFIYYRYLISASEVAEATATLQMQRRLNKEEEEHARVADLGKRIIRQQNASTEQSHPPKPIPGTTVSLTLDDPKEPEDAYTPPLEGMEPWRTGAICKAQNSPWITGSVEECMRQGHLFQCFGCRYYVLDDAELHRVLDERKKSVDDAARAIQEAASDTFDFKIKADQLLMELNTHFARYSTACNIHAAHQADIWRRYHPIENGETP